MEFFFARFRCAAVLVGAASSCKIVARFKFVLPYLYNICVSARATSSDSAARFFFAFFNFFVCCFLLFFVAVCCFLLYLCNVKNMFNLLIF